MITRDEYLKALEVIDNYHRQNKEPIEQKQERIPIQNFISFLMMNHFDNRLIGGILRYKRRNGFEYVDELDALEHERGVGRRTMLSFAEGLNKYNNYII